MGKLQYGAEEVYEDIKYEIQQSPLFRFDWFFKSRTSAELSKRCASLIGVLQKEEEQEDKKAVKKRKSNIVKEDSKKLKTSE